MLKISRPLTYFYGEFGCLNYCIMGHIEEMQPNIAVSTQPDYLKLMQIKCPNITQGMDTGIYRADCKGSGFGLSIDPKKLNFLETIGYKSLKNFMKLSSDRCINHIKPIKNPFIFDIGLTKNYIGVSFRNRSHEKERNLSKSNWLQILHMIRKHTDMEIVAHGMDLDTINSNEFEKFEIKKAHNIEESIAYLNRSKLFIGSMSGIAQFASNCACPIIQIGDVSRHFHYDPFEKGCMAFENHKGYFEKFLTSFIEK